MSLKIFRTLIIHFDVIFSGVLSAWYSIYENLVNFPRISLFQKPSIFDFIVISSGKRPNSAYKIYEGVLRLHLVIQVHREQYG